MTLTTLNNSTTLATSGRTNGTGITPPASLKTSRIVSGGPVIVSSMLQSPSSLLMFLSPKGRSVSCAILSTNLERLEAKKRLLDRILDYIIHIVRVFGSTSYDGIDMSHSPNNQIKEIANQSEVTVKS